ncbi:hypothetical protein BLNAU_8700 [Blattamonas nauphoetae]|uniref:Uncharacterized protein n=1 Tax=Blattamonas nauphoetae TaxID=2049346 RepID=A0ABQ9XXY6_9EUKA|nr:hypothetical protein BLNAU_8700 [Blattamonas nauphoetae]
MEPPTQVAAVPYLNNSNFTLDKQHSDNEIPTEFSQKQYFKNRMDKVDEVDWNLADETLFSQFPVKFLRSLEVLDEELADAFLNNFASISDEPLADYVQCVGVLIASPNRAITTAALKMLRNQMAMCSTTVLLMLVTADLLPQLMNTLNPQSLSFAEAVDIHSDLLIIIPYSYWLSSPRGLASLEIEDHTDQQAVHETVLQQVLAPSEQYIRHLCTNRYSILDGGLSFEFVDLVARFLEISPFYPPTMDFVLQMPVILTIPSCLTFFDCDRSIWHFLYQMNDTQQELNEQGGEGQQMWKKVLQMLRMEGIEDVIEQKLLNDNDSSYGELIVDNSITLNNLQGMNLLKHKSDWDSLSPVSLKGRHPLLLLRRLSRTAPLWKAMQSTEFVANLTAVLDPCSPHHPHPPTPICLSITTHTLPLPSASPSPPTPSHFHLPLPHHPHPPTPICLSITTHILPLPSASPSPPTPSHSHLPLPHHPHPPTPICLSLTTHTLPLPSASPSPPTPSHFHLPLHHHPHPPTPICLSLTTHQQSRSRFLTQAVCQRSILKTKPTSWD